MDLIERQKAIDALDEQIEQCNKALSSFDISLKDEFAIKVERASLKAYREQLENLPPVKPKKGKWLPDNRCGGGYWVCSSCKYPTEAFAADVLYKYCPFCGADMRGGKDGTD